MVIKVKAGVYQINSVYTTYSNDNAGYSLFVAVDDLSTFSPSTQHRYEKYQASFLR